MIVVYSLQLLLHKLPLLHYNTSYKMWFLPYVQHDSNSYQYYYCTKSDILYTLYNVIQVKQVPWLITAFILTKTSDVNYDPIFLIVLYKYVNEICWTHLLSLQHHLAEWEVGWLHGPSRQCCRDRGAAPSSQTRQRTGYTAWHSAPCEVHVWIKETKNLEFCMRQLPFPSKNWVCNIQKANKYWFKKVSLSTRGQGLENTGLENTTLLFI